MVFRFCNGSPPLSGHDSLKAKGPFGETRSVIFREMHASSVYLSGPGVMSAYAAGDAHQIAFLCFVDYLFFQNL